MSGRVLALGSLVVVASLAADAGVLRRGMVLEDEGTTIALAARMAAGQTLYRDMPINLAPGVYELLALVFGVTGTSYLAARLLVALASAATAWLSFLAARHAGAGDYPALVAPWLFLLLRPFAFPSWHMALYTPFALAAALASLVLLMDGRWLVAAGLAAGVAAIFKQNYGAIALLVGMVMVLLGDRRPRAATRFLVGFGAPPCAMAALYAWRGAFADFFRWTVKFAVASQGEVFRVAAPSPWPTLAPDPAFRAGFLFYVPPLFLESIFPAVAGTWLWRSTGVIESALKMAFYLPWLLPPLLLVAPPAGRQRAARGLALCAMAFLVLGSYPSLDWAHHCYGLPPALACAAVLLARLGRARRAVGAVLMAATLATAAFTFGALRPYRCALPAVGLAVPVGMGRPLLEASAWLHARGAREILVVPYQPGFYHLSGLANATAFDIFLPRFVTAADERAVAGVAARVPVVRFRKEYAHLQPFARSFPDLEALLVHPDATFAGDGFSLEIFLPASAAEASRAP